MYDPDETVTITASAEGYVSGSDTLVVTNIDPLRTFRPTTTLARRVLRWQPDSTLVTHNDPMWQPEADGLGSRDRAYRRRLCSETWLP